MFAPRNRAEKAPEHRHRNILERYGECVVLVSLLGHRCRARNFKEISVLHRFKTGQVLELRSAPRQTNRPSGPCEVISCMPHDRGPVLYRVRSLSETIERVVEEADLSLGRTIEASIAETQSVFAAP